MLTAKENRYLEIAISLKNSTMDKVAEKFGVSRETVKAAAKWGKLNRVYNVMESEIAEARRIELRQYIEMVETRLKKVLKRVDRVEELTDIEMFPGESEEKYFKRLGTLMKEKNLIPDTRLYVPLMKELREARYDLAELEGIIQRNEREFAGQTNQYLIYIAGKDASSEDWQKAASKVIEQSDRISQIKERIGEVGTV